MAALGLCIAPSRRRAFRGFSSTAATVLALAAAGSCAASVVTTSTPYLSPADSTLNPASPTYYLETFESGALTLPGVSVTSLSGSGVQSGFSVVSDGLVGMHYAGATSAFQTNTTFFFSPVAGQWPRQVAIAVTGGSANALSFGAYDTNLNPSGGTVLNVSGVTPANAFLVTFLDNAGIGAIAMTSSQAFTYMHYDHLQFDTAAAVPEAGAFAMVALVVSVPGGLALWRRRAVAGRVGGIECSHAEGD
jgi:hypothetical protein